MPVYARNIIGGLAVVAAVLVAFGFASAVPFAIVGALAIVGVMASRGTVQNLCICIASLAIILGVTECVAMMITTRIVVDHPGSNVPRLTIGWGPGRPGAYHVTQSLAGRVVYDVTYGIDDRLLRKVDAGSTGKGVSFFGDSFMFGTGVNDKDTLPQLFADDTKRAFPVFDLGVPGWSPAHVLAELQSGWADDVMARTRLNVQFVAPWHAERMVCGSQLSGFGPRYELIDGKVAFAAPCPKRASFLSLFAFYRVLIAPHLRHISDSELALLVAVTDETIRLSLEKYKTPMIIYYLRDPAYLRGLSWSDERIMASFEAAGAQVLDYSLQDPNSPKYRIQGDGHPTALANKLRAERLVAFIRDHDPAVGNPAANGEAAQARQ